MSELSELMKINAPSEFVTCNGKEFLIKRRICICGINDCKAHYEIYIKRKFLFFKWFSPVLINEEKHVENSIEDARDFVIHCYDNLDGVYIPSHPL